MSSILVKEMSMPTECEYCGFCRYYQENGRVWCNAKNRILKQSWDKPDWTHLDIRKPDWCPLAEVKTPHVRLIDADALIGDLHNHAFLEGDDRSICYNVIQKQPTIEPEQKWIPVSEWLPEPRWKDVLVTRDYKGAEDGNKDKRYVEVASLCGDEWVSYSDEYKIHPKNHRVIAWMELPEPWCGGEPGC